jgi:hypothetical protein
LPMLLMLLLPLPLLPPLPMYVLVVGVADLRARVVVRLTLRLPLLPPLASPKADVRRGAPGGGA